MLKETLIHTIKMLIEGSTGLIFFKGFNKEMIQEAASELYIDADVLANKEDIEKQIQAGKRVGLFEHAITLGDKQVIYRNNLFYQDFTFVKKDEASKKIMQEIKQEKDYIYDYYIRYEDLGEYYKFYYNSIYKTKKIFEAKEIQSKTSKKEPIYFKSYKYDLFLINLLNGKDHEVNVVCKNTDEYEQAKVIMSYLDTPYSLTIENRDHIVENCLVKAQKVKVKKEYTELLKKYWGEEASFRNLKFYKNPQTKEIAELSQGQLISTIITQTNLCKQNKAYQDIFITAPTGAGKSLLFQIPSIYLHENRNALTIIITPLIALMKDQVDGMEARGMHYATYLNSTIDFTQREMRIAAIKNGEKSLLYIAPELLVNTSLEYFIGDREIGLFVVDEAHTVTSWGKDFRIDYWFLGDYLLNLRQNGRRFPVLCLTATAVYGGKEDVVNETINTLNLMNPCIYLGNVKRENIRYYITTSTKDEIKGSLKEYKQKKVELFIKRCLIKREKALIYCPYVVQVNELYEALPEKMKLKVGKYHARLSNDLRLTMQEDFKKGNKLVMICTKAFGMGIDDPNITNIYHYAPTGNLADYVQEIGRAARNPAINGLAKSDYLDSDLRYVDTLYSVSGFKDFQLREVIRKIYSIYEEKQSKNLLISPETFSYLFDSDNLDGKVKNALFLIEKDLEVKYGFKLLSVVPQSVNRQNYVCVPYDKEEEFLSKYKKYCTLLKDDAKVSTNSIGAVTTITHFGNIFRVNMAELWQNEFENLTFIEFKRQFFNGDLFADRSVGKPLAMLRFMLEYNYDYATVQSSFKQALLKLTKIFDEYHTINKYFTEEQFRASLTNAFPEIMSHLDITNMLLDLFTTSQVASLENLNRGKSLNRVKFIQRRHDSNTNITSFRVCNTNYNNLDYHYSYILTRFVPNRSQAYHSFITYHRDGSKAEELELASLLELLNLASYQVYGGNNSEVALTIYEPKGVSEVLENDYMNTEVAAIKNQRKASIEILKKFFGNSLESDERWEFVENYFLGKDVLA